MGRRSKFDHETQLRLANEALSSSPREVATRAGVSVGTIYTWMKKAGLKAKGGSDPVTSQPQAN